MKNEPVHMNDLSAWQCLALPTQQPRISRVSGSLKLFLPLFTLPLSQMFVPRSQTTDLLHPSF